MGKCGAHELNYVSDVDVIFVGEPADGVPEQQALRVATQLAAAMMQICSDQTGEGTIWPVDANLRPEGRAGPLVRTLASYRGYYERWAKTWEFQALLKARPVAGDLALGRAFVELVEPMVWSVAERDGFVTDVQAMRRRVIDHIPQQEAERQLKLGSGGLRDVEFAVQLLQLVHGRADPRVRQPTTLSALAELTRAGYVGREDGDALGEAYAWLRTLEHRMQLFQLRRIHVVPEQEEALRRLGRSLGYLKDPVQSLDEAWNHHRREVRRLHEKLFYRPLLEAVARIPGEEARLSPEAARQRLAALGYQDPLGRVAASRSAHQRCLPHRRHPAGAAAGHAGVVRRRAGSRRRALRLPPDQRGAGTDAVVSQDAARRGSGGAAAGAAARHLPLRHRPPRARARGRAAARRGPGPPAGRRRCSARCGPWPAASRLGRGRRARRPRDPAPRAVPDLLGRPARRSRRRRCRRRTVPAHRRDARGDARGRRARGDRGAWSRRAADPDRRRRDGPVRRLRAGLRQRCRRDVRPRAARRRRPAAGGVVRPGRGQRAAPAAGAPRHRPAARHRRRPAPRGPPGRVGAHAGLLCRLLREVVEGLGVPGLAAGRRRGRRRRAAPSLHRARRPAPLPRGGASRRPTSARSTGSRRASTTSGCPAAPTRTPTSNSAAAASPTSSGPPSSSRCGTPAPTPACAAPAPSRR